ncbi:MAG: hypothetical protein ACD_56C00146G0004 [uncultured bacterium]|nr:MAG: hypothetical protein ACD_56C00146G0004 [uncultured bacterium]
MTDLSRFIFIFLFFLGVFVVIRTLSLRNGGSEFSSWRFDGAHQERAGRTLGFVDQRDVFQQYQEKMIDYSELEIKNDESIVEPEKESAKEVVSENLSPSENSQIAKTVVKKPAPKKPATIGLPGPILSDVRIVNGRNVCEHENDKPKKSKKTSKVHIDGECCLDPDEIPNSNCYYPQDKYGKLIQKYLNSQK